MSDLVGGERLQLYDLLREHFDTQHLTGSPKPQFAHNLTDSVCLRFEYNTDMEKYCVHLIVTLGGKDYVASFAAGPLQPHPDGKGYYIAEV
jgi:hypothetical protein